MEESLTGRDPYTGESLIVNYADGRITGIKKGAAGETFWLTPGLIDLQVNGYSGDDVNADNLTIDTVQSLAHHMLTFGVTTFAPTLITASEQKIIHNLRIIAAARQADPLLAHMIPFVHVEGPHIAPEDGPRGAHPLEHVRPPDVAEFIRWQAACSDLVGIVTLSPHYAEAQEYIRKVSARGVHISLGHTGASADQIRAAVDAGARLSTHLGNGAANMLPRHPNLIWAQLAEDRLTASFIADGRHLPPDTLTAMLRVKTVPRAILVSDLVTLAGLPPANMRCLLVGKSTFTQMATSTLPAAHISPVQPPRSMFPSLTSPPTPASPSAMPCRWPRLTLDVSQEHEAYSASVRPQTLYSLAGAKALQRSQSNPSSCKERAGNEILLAT